MLGLRKLRPRCRSRANHRRAQSSRASASWARWWISRSLMSRTLISGPLISRTLMSRALISGPLISRTLMSRALISPTRCSHSRVAGTRASTSLLSMVPASVPWYSVQPGWTRLMWSRYCRRPSQTAQVASTGWRQLPRLSPQTPRRGLARPRRRCRLRVPRALILFASPAEAQKSRRPI